MFNDLDEVIDIDFDFILQILSDIDLGERGEVHLISPEGRDRVFKQAAPDRFIKSQEKLEQPQELKIDMLELKAKLREEYFLRQKLLKRILSDYASSSLIKMFEQDIYNIDILMWTQLVYQLLFSYKNGSQRVKKDIIEALKPLYFTRSVTFNYQTWRYNAKYVEEAILEQAKAFAAQKPYYLGLHVNELKKKAAKCKAD